MDSKMLLGVVIGLIAGLVLGVFVGVLFISPGLLPDGVGKNNQVQVSGYIQDKEIFQIEFSSIQNGTVKTSAPVSEGGYRALLIGGQSYNVYLYSRSYYNGNVPRYTFSLYVPSGVTYFTTANF